MNGQTENTWGSSKLHTLSLVVVSVFLIFTALGNATVMFWGALVAMIAVALWYAKSHNQWFAVLAGIVIAIAVAIQINK